MFNFEKVGRKIGIIKGGKKDKEYIYLSDDESVKNGFKEIKLDEGATLQPLPNKNIVEKVYISGPSSSGKSYYAGKWLKELHKMYPDMPLICFSPVEEDKALDSLPLDKIDLDQHLLNNPMRLDEMVNSCIIFDDVDILKNPQMKKYISNIRDTILIRGRHTNTRMVYISHLISNYSDTRNLLNESTSCTVYPRSGSGTYQIKKFLQIQCGMNKDEMKRFLTSPSRWVTVYRSYPMYVVHQKGCYIPKLCDDDE